MESGTSPTVNGLPIRASSERSVNFSSSQPVNAASTLYTPGFKPPELKYPKETSRQLFPYDLACDSRFPEFVQPVQLFAQVAESDFFRTEFNAM
jgi:hypothetical protein